MRIIGGKYKRRRFDVPKSFNARPTTDFAKENLFNVLQHYIDLEGTTALDLFSGTGSIAVELLSRGVSRVVALEQRREHASFIRSVARELGEEAHLQVLQADAFRFLQWGGSTSPSTTSSLLIHPIAFVRSPSSQSSSSLRACYVRVEYSSWSILSSTTSLHSLISPSVGSTAL